MAAPSGGVGTVGRRREVWGGLVGERGVGGGGEHAGYATDGSSERSAPAACGP